jgi:hypothetical protein
MFTVYFPILQRLKTTGLTAKLLINCLKASVKANKLDAPFLENILAPQQTTTTALQQTKVGSALPINIYLHRIGNIHIKVREY